MSLPALDRSLPHPSPVPHMHNPQYPEECLDHHRHSTHIY